jgi:hypothetical protein
MYETQLGDIIRTWSCERAQHIQKGKYILRAGWLLVFWMYSSVTADPQSPGKQDLIDFTNLIEVWLATGCLNPGSIRDHSAN